MGRRLLFAFAYSFFLEFYKFLPSNPTAPEIQNAVQMCGSQLRDSSDSVRFVERGDFLLFTGRTRINQMWRLLKAELDVSG